MFTEMNQNELMETEGGAVGWLIFAIVVLACGCLSSCSNSCDAE